MENTTTQTIVLGKVEMTGLVLIPEYERFDGVNYRQKTAAAPEAKAMVWLLEGTAEDVQKADVYAKTEGYQVMIFPVEEDDPLGKAKTALLVEFQTNGN